MAKALRASFQRTAHRVLPVPLGSRDRVTRYRHFRAALLGGEMASGLDGSSVTGVEALDGVGRAQHLADLDVAIEERDDSSQAFSHNRMTAG
jgi:hypothetical protein